MPAGGVKRGDGRAPICRPPAAWRAVAVRRIPSKTSPPRLVFVLLLVLLLAFAPFAALLVRPAALALVAAAQRTPRSGSQRDKGRRRGATGSSCGAAAPADERLPHPAAPALALRALLQLGHMLLEQSLAFLIILDLQQERFLWSP